MRNFLSIQTSGVMGALRGASLAVLLVGAAIALGIEAYAGGARGLFSFFTCWTLLPLVCFYAAVRIMTPGEAPFVMVTTVATVCLGSLFYVDAFFIHLDPQSGLIFLAVPFYQMVAVAILFLGIFISRVLRGRAADVYSDEEAQA